MASRKAHYVVGVDVGGTYTDLFILDETTGALKVGKVASQRGTEALGILNALQQNEVALAETSTIVHGTTVGTNALLERKGAVTGLITTKGFRDVLEMRRRNRPQTWGLWGTFEPVVTRDRRLEIAERTLADGDILEKPDIGEIEALAAQLKASGAESVALCLINSHANPENERALASALRKAWDNPDYVTVSSEILPEVREFERTSTTALNAYLQPLVGRYLQALAGALHERDFGGEILIVQSNGGVMSLDTARERPVRTALSGPAAGVIAAQHIASAAGFPNVITGDVGGTSFDVSLIANGKTTLAAQTSIDFGMVIRSPMIEMHTIGAGGGSIAYIDRGGILQVGPESAGSVPGPACYGRGNDRPTVTDANVLLNRINAKRPIGSSNVTLDVEAARRAINTHIARPLNLPDEDAAEAVIRVANSLMAGAIRLLSIERGHDPRKFALLPFGGGGSLHAGSLIKDVGLAQALVPRYPGITSALGCVIADMRHDFVATLNRLLSQIDFDGLNARIAELEKSGGAMLDESGVKFVGRELSVALDMSYVGQTHTVSVPLSWSIAMPLDETIVAKRFEEVYRDTFGNVLNGIAARVFNLNVTVIGQREKIDLSILAPPADASIERAFVEKRKVYAGGQWTEASVYRRLDLPAGARLDGPALLEQPDTTIWVEPDLEATVDRFGNLIMRLKA